jgi:hypothetical protein
MTNMIVATTYTSQEAVPAMPPTTATAIAGVKVGERLAID